MDINVLSKAEVYCARSEHCEQEVRNKLYAWGADINQIDEIIDNLIDNGYISSERYCRAFVHDKVLFQSWGREKIRAALAAKRLPLNDIKSALKDFPQDEYMQVLQRLAEKKMKEYKENEADVAEAKLINYLLARGFTYKELQQLER